MEKSKVNFAKKALENSIRFSDNPFIRFIILWIGLNALYSQKGWEIDGRNYGEDVVMNYFTGRQKTVYSLISRKRRELNELFRFISTTKQHKRLFDYLRTRKDFLKSKPDTEQRAIHTFTEFLYKIRNNMFHAVKKWDETREAELLVGVNPVLEDLLKNLIETELSRARTQ